MSGEGGEGGKKDWLETLKSFSESASGFVGAISAFGEDKLNLLSFLSPDVRNWQGAAIAAVLMGFVASKAAKRTRTLAPGWISLLVAMVSLVLLCLWGTERSLVDSDARVWMAKVAYILFFGFGAATLAWFWSSDSRGPEEKRK
jgi:hypothetical protein